MYVVKLLNKPILNDFRSDYFPRKFRYKKDADELVKEVERKGGRAEVKKSK